MLAIAECWILTTEQVAAFIGMTDQAARKHLRDLFDLGLVRRFGIPPAVLADLSRPNDHRLLGGRAQTVHGLSPEGAKLLVQQHLVEKEEVKDLPDYGPRNALFLAHEVGVRDVRVWLQRVKRAYPSHPGVTAWRYGSATTIDLGRDQYPREVRPDAIVIYKTPRANLVGFVEVDRSTERKPTTWEDKFRQYEALYATNRIEELTGQQTGRVIITTPDAQRRDQISGILGALMKGSTVPRDRFWIIQASALTDATHSDDAITSPPIALDLTKDVWRVPGRPVLTPFLPANVL